MTGVWRAAVIATLLASPGAAQVSLERADEVMSGRDNELAAFQERLNDPDPDRALAILKLLITEGDADQRRLDIRHEIDRIFGSKRADRMDIGFSDAERLPAPGLRHGAGQFGMELRRSHLSILRP